LPADPKSPRNQRALSARPSVLSICTERGIIKRAAIIAAVVGTILNLVAQGDFLIEGKPISIWKILLTYCVPYCVATYGAVTARLEAYRRADWA
jgi:hypothetical protein